MLCMKCVLSSEHCQQVPRTVFEFTLDAFSVRARINKMRAPLKFQKCWFISPLWCRGEASSRSNAMKYNVLSFGSVDLLPCSIYIYSIWSPFSVLNHTLSSCTVQLSVYLVIITSFCSNEFSLLLCSGQNVGFFFLCFSQNLTWVISQRVGCVSHLGQPLNHLVVLLAIHGPPKKSIAHTGLYQSWTSVLLLVDLILELWSLFYCCAISYGCVSFKLSIEDVLHFLLGHLSCGSHLSSLSTTGEVSLFLRSVSHSRQSVSLLSCAFFNLCDLCSSNYYFCLIKTLL